MRVRTVFSTVMSKKLALARIYLSYSVTGVGTAGQGAPPPASVLTRDKDIKRNCHTETTTNTITQVGCDPFNCTTKHNVGVLKHTVRIFVMLPTINVLLTFV